jgi:para-nitrobenzyl esterase
MVGYDLDSLAAVDPARMIAAAGAVLSHYRSAPGLRQQVPTVFSPVIGGDTLPTTPLRAIAAGSARDVDLLLRHTVDEFRLMLDEPERV